MNPENSQAPIIVQLHDASLSLPASNGMLSILHNLQLSVHENETVAIVGPSGSGKTSMLMLIAGLEAPTEGRILVCGQDITQYSEDELAQFRARNVGIVFQSFHLIPTMTALENVAIPLEFSGQKEARKRAAETLETLGLGERLHHYPSQLSGGEQQRVAIGRAFAARPKLLLADEPTGNLDHDTGAHVIDLLFNLQQQHGTTLMLITHDVELANRCQRVVHISDGRIV